jgi:glutathione S-transferase
MASDRKIVLFHCPQTRSSGTLTLLEELGAPYELQVIDLRKGAQNEPAFRAINPMGKVPTVRHGDAVITEQSALTIYLADLFPQSGIAPLLGDPLRGPYLRWIVFYSSCLEPAAVDRALKREPGSRAMMSYGDYESTVSAVNGQLAAGPWMLGERFSAADVLWGTALSWLTGFGLVEATPAIRAYVDRWNARPSVARVAAIDAKLLAGGG